MHLVTECGYIHFSISRTVEEQAKHHGPDTPMLGELGELRGQSVCWPWSAIGCTHRVVYMVQLDGSSSLCDGSVGCRGMCV